MRVNYFTYQTICSQTNVHKILVFTSIVHWHRKLWTFFVGKPTQDCGNRTVIAPALAVCMPVEKNPQARRNTQTLAINNLFRNYPLRRFCLLFLIPPSSAKKTFFFSFLGRASPIRQSSYGPGLIH